MKKVDAPRVDESLAKGLVKRLLREGHENTHRIVTDQWQYAMKGKRSASAQYRARIKVLKRSLGHTIVSEFAIVKQLRGKKKETARAVIGIDTHDEEAPVGHFVSLLMLHIDKKSGAVTPHVLRIQLAVHMLERLVERYQITDMNELSRYLKVPCSMGITMSVAKKTIEQGRYLAMGSTGFAIIEVGEHTIMVVTWVPRKLWVPSQEAFFEAHADGYSCLITQETHMHVAKPVVRRRELDISAWNMGSALLVEY